MFVAFGIISILVGIFVYRQGAVLSALSMAFLSDAGLTVGGAFVLVAICMVIAGAFSCGCKSGERRGCVKVAITFYLIGALVGFAFNYGDLKIWSIVCLALAVIYIIWLLRHKKATTQQINNRVDNQADNNGQ